MTHHNHRRTFLVLAIALIGALLFSLAPAGGIPRAAAALPEGLSGARATSDPYLFLEKTAAEVQCRTYDVTLSITGYPPVKPVDVILVIDHSGSMAIGAPPASLNYAQDAANTFAAQLLADPNNRVGVVNYTDYIISYRDLTNDLGLVQTTIGDPLVGEPTNIQLAVRTAWQMMRDQARPEAEKAIVVLTDGVADMDIGSSCATWPTAHTDCTIAAYTEGIAAQAYARVFTVGLLGYIHSSHATSEPVAADTLYRMAEGSGSYFQTYSAANLNAIYSAIAGQVVPAATNVVVTDIVSPNFDLVGASLTPSQGTTSVAGNTITWDVGTVGSAAVTLTYRVTARPGVTGNQALNQSASMAYTNAFGVTGQTETFPVPSVTVVPELTVNAGADVTILEGSSTTLGGEPVVTGGTPPYTYTWVPATGLSDAHVAHPIASPLATTTYTLYVASADACGSDSVTVTVTPNNPPVGNVDNARTCKNTPVAIDVTANDADADGSVDKTTVTITQNPAHGTVSVNPTTGVVTFAPTAGYSSTTPDSFKYRVKDNLGKWSNETAVYVTIDAGPANVNITADYGELSCAHMSATLTVTANSSYPPLAFRWFKDGVEIGGETSATLVVTAPGTYKVVVTDSHNCANEKTITITGTNPPAVSVTVDHARLYCTVNMATLTATPSGGKSPYAFKWSKDGAEIAGQTAAALNVTEGGVYTVTVTDANGCSGSSAGTTVTRVTNPSATLAADGAELSCNHTSALLTPSVSGGESPFTYAWYKDGALIAGAAGATYTATAPGAYHVAVTDANNCAATSADVTVTGVPNPSVTVAVDNAALFCTHATAYLTATVTGGEAPLTYQWKNGATVVGTNSRYLSVTGPGSYTVTVTDNNGCAATSTAVSVSSTANPSAAVTSDGGDLHCGHTTATLTASVTNGQAPFSYQWYDGAGAIASANGQTYGATAAGAYHVVVSDVNGCAATSADFTVTQTGAPTVTLAVDDGELDCANGDARLTATASGGKPGYTYAWYRDNVLIGGATGATYTTTQAGVYKVVVTDANTCQVTSSTVTVVSIANPTLSVAVDNAVLFCTHPTAHFTATVTGGKTPFQYQWLKGSSTPVGDNSPFFSTNVTGFYKVRVTDANGCQVTSGTTEITKDSALAIELGAERLNLDCNHTSSLLTATASGGKKPYTYVWTKDGVLIPGATNATYTATAAGVYNVTVTDARGCTAVPNAVPITYMGSPSVTVSVDDAELDCTNSDTVLTAVASGGSPAYHYQWQKYAGSTWNNVGGGTSATLTVTNPADYRVDVWDANNCHAYSATITVFRTGNPVVTLTSDGSDLHCDHASALLTAPATGKSPFTYAWYRDGALISGATGATLTATQTGVYKAMVTDANGCATTSSTLTVTSTPAPTVALSADNAELNCLHATAMLTAAVTGGKSPLTLVWYRDGSVISGATGTTYTATVGGIFKVEVTDANGCQVTSNTVTVTKVTNPAVTVAIDNAAIFCTHATAYLTATVTGGEAPFHYQWKNGGTVVGSDSAYMQTHDGGSFTVTVTDGNNCAATPAAVAVTGYDNPSVNLTADGSDLHCGHTTATLTANATSGQPPLSYAWYRNGTPIAGATGTTYGAAAPGVYGVVVTDAHGCQSPMAGTEVTQTGLPAVALETDVAELNCNVPSAHLTASASGGKPGYTYAWYRDNVLIGGATGATYTANAGGVYKVTVTDGNTCQVTSNTVTIGKFANPAVTVAVDNSMLFCTHATAHLTATVTGGESPFHYAWFNGSNPVGSDSPYLSAADAGAYTVRVTDANGCQATSTGLAIQKDDALTAQLTADRTLLACDVTSATLTVTAAGGKSPYTYAWYRDDVPIPSVAGTAYVTSQGGTFKVVVTDSRGCTAAANTVTITAPGTPAVTVAVDDSDLDCSNADALLTATAGGGQPPYGYQWYGKSGATWTAIGGATGPTLTVTAANDYRVVVTDANECAAGATATVTATPNPSGTLTADGAELSCSHTQATLTFTVTGGKAPFSYAWTTPAGPLTTAEDHVTVSVAGHYAVVVTDGNGCTAQGAIDITFVPIPLISISTPDHELYCTHTQATLTSVLTGGEGPFQYQWFRGTQPISGAQSGAYTASQAGTYWVRVTDANGCSANSNQVTLTSFDNPAVALTADDAELNCGNSDTLLTCVVSGGKGPFTYAWYKDDVLLAGAGGASYTATEPGSYKVVVTDAHGCTSASNVIAVTLVPNPQVTLTVDDAELNCNNPDAMLTANVGGGEGPFSYQWYKDGALIGGASGATYTAAGPGVFKVTITDHNGCSATSATVEVRRVANPVVFLVVDDGELSCNNPDALLTAGAAGGEAPYAYEWYKDGVKITGAGGSTYTVAAAGVFKVVVTDHNGCVMTSGEITVIAVPNPQVSVAADDAELNCNNGDTLLTATASGGETPYAYQWFKDGVAISGAVNSTYTATAAGVYKVVVTDQNQCTAMGDEVTIVQVANPAVTLGADDAELSCNNPDALLTATVSGGEAPYGYLWFKDGSGIPGATGSTYTATAAGVYKVVVKDHNGCTATSNDITVVDVPNPQVAIAADDAELNCNNRDALLTATASGGETPYGYQWYKDGTAIAGANQSTYTATSTGAYRVVLTDHNQCTATSNEVTVAEVPNPQVAIAADDAELNCNNRDALLTATASGGETPYGYQWYKDGTAISGAVQSTYTATSAGVYKVVLTDNNKCTATSNEITVVDVPNPQVSIVADDAELNCNNRETVFTAAASAGEAPYTYQWYWNGIKVSGATGPTHTEMAAGVVKVVVTDNNGCTATSNEITVVDVPNPTVAISAATVVQCTATGEFTATGSAGELPYTLAWDLDGDGQYDDAVGATVSYTFPDDGSYTVAVELTDANGCKAYAQTSVTIKVPDPNVDITKAIDKALVHPGDPVSYHYVVTNTGACALLDVTLTDDKLGAIALIGLTDQDGDGTADDMAPGASATADKGATIQQDTVNIATVTGKNFRGKVFTAKADVKVIVIHPAIDLVKEGPKYAYEGETITYVFTVTNTSPDTVLNNVTVSDPMLGGVIWGPQALAIGQSVRFTVDYTIPVGAPNPLQNTAKTQGTDILGWTVTDADDHSLYVLRPLGFKFEDAEGDGRYQSSQDPLLGGWQIRLLNEETRQAWTVATATGGQFFGKWFAPKDLPAGKYWVDENQRNGWTQTYPGQNGGYEIEVHEDGSYTLLSPQTNEFIGLSFGNHQGTPAAADCGCVDWLVFDSNRDGNWELYGTSADGSNLVRLTNSPAQDIAPTIRNASSVDRTLVAFQSDRDGKWHIYTVDTMGGSLKRLTWQGNNTDPVWSTECNSHYLAFVSDRDGNQEIYVMNADGNSQVRLTNDGGADTDPSWGPDAGSLVFQSNRTGKWQLYRIDRTGANLKRLTNDNANDVDPAWSPDGKWIAFRSDRDGQWNTYIMPAAGGEAIRLSAGGDNVGAVWSPDSSKLAYQSSRDGKWQVYVVDVASKVESRVVTDTANDEWATWNCTSDGLVFQTDRSGNWELVYYGLDGQQRAQTTDNPGADVYPAWNPAEEDGSLFGMDVMVPAPAAAAVAGGIKPAKPKATPNPARLE